MPSGLHQSHLMGYIVNRDTMSILRFQYNPPEWQDSHGNEFSEIDSPGSEYPVIFYGKGESDKITLSLEFYAGGSKVGFATDTPESAMAKIRAMGAPRRRQTEMIRGSNHFISPPVCVFCWGNEARKFVLQKYKFDRKRFNRTLQTTVMTATLEMLLIR